MYIYESVRRRFRAEHESSGKLRIKIFQCRHKDLPHSTFLLHRSQHSTFFQLHIQTLTYFCIFVVKGRVSVIFTLFFLYCAQRVHVGAWNIYIFQSQIPRLHSAFLRVCSTHTNVQAVDRDKCTNHKIANRNSKHLTVYSIQVWIEGGVSNQVAFLPFLLSQLKNSTCTALQFRWFLVL